MLAKATLRAETKLIDVDVFGRRLHPALDLVFGFELAGLRCHEAENHLLALGNQPQRLETAGALSIVFHEISVDIRPVEQNIGDGIIAAGPLESGAEVAAAQMHGGNHVGRLVLQCGIGRVRIKFRQLLGIVAVLDEELALLWIDQNDHIDFVELQIAAAGVAEGAHDLAIGFAEVGVEFSERIVHRSIKDGLAVMGEEGTRRWDCHLRNRAGRRDRLQITKVVDHRVA